MGISDTPSPTFGSSPYRGYRGRGRGRGFFRGAMRGGPPRSSMKLDNRTKSLVVRGVKAQDPEYVQAVRGWYEVSNNLGILIICLTFSCSSLMDRSIPSKFRTTIRSWLPSVLAQQQSRSVIVLFERPMIILSHLLL